jgi:hypothetical protein
MKIRTSLIDLLVVCVIGVCSIYTAAAQPAGPPAGYSIDPEFTEKSPDAAITIEQYVNKDTDDWKWQFWTRREGTLNLLDPEPADYPAGFRFTNDLKWLVRMQKTGSGESTLYLYRPGPRNSQRFCEFLHSPAYWAEWSHLVLHLAEAVRIGSVWWRAGGPDNGSAERDSVK